MLELYVLLFNVFCLNACFFMFLLDLICNFHQILAFCKRCGTFDLTSHLYNLSDFAKEFAGEGSVLFGNSIGSLCVLAAAAKEGSDLFKYVTFVDALIGAHAVYLSLVLLWGQDSVCLTKLVL